MIKFCPWCLNLLMVKKIDGQMYLDCLTCPYQYAIEEDIVCVTKYETKHKPDDVVSEADRWKYAESTEINCPKCHHNRAYFYMVQIRSADEPMTIFYRCCKVDCHHNWRDN